MLGAGLLPRVSVVKPQPRDKEIGLPPLLVQKAMLPPWWAWRTEHSTKEDYSQALKSNGICLVRIVTCLGLVTLSSDFYLFGMGMSISCLFTILFFNSMLF